MVIYVLSWYYPVTTICSALITFTRYIPDLLSMLEARYPFLIKLSVDLVGVPVSPLTTGFLFYQVTQSLSVFTQQTHSQVNSQLGCHIFSKMFSLSGLKSDFPAWFLPLLPPLPPPDSLWQNISCWGTYPGLDYLCCLNSGIQMLTITCSQFHLHRHFSWPDLIVLGTHSEKKRRE